MDFSESDTDQQQGLLDAGPRHRAVLFAAIIAAAAFVVQPLPHSFQQGPAQPPSPAAPWVAPEYFETSSAEGSLGSPRLQLLSYREGLIAGLRWLHGAHVHLYDHLDRRPGSVWIVTPTKGAPSIRVELTARIDRGGDAALAFECPNGRVVLRTMRNEGTAAALDGGADAALDDLPKVVQLLGLGDAAVHPAPFESPLAPWQPGSIIELASALAPLNKGEAAGPVALSRAARALAWQALVDYRLAPTLSVDRAAQSLALASVAERWAGRSLPEARAARWLAPGAAAADFILLGSTPPPPGCPELEPLHSAYASTDLPSSRPQGPLRPMVVGFFERAMALEQFGHADRLAQWVTNPDDQRVLFPTLCTSREFSTIARTRLAALMTPLEDLSTVSRSLDEPLQLGPVEKKIFESMTAVRASPSDEVNPAHFKRMPDIAYGLMASSQTAKSPVDRILLEEVGERLLVGAHLYASFWQSRGLPKQLEPYHRALLALGGWAHPVLQWQLSEVFDRLGANLNTSAHRAVMAWQYFPGLAEDKLNALAGQIASGVLEQAAMAVIGQFQSHPAMILRAARVRASQGRFGEALAMMDTVARNHGDHWAPQLVQYSALPSTALGLRLALLPPGSIPALPEYAVAQARQLQVRGKVKESIAVLDKARTGFPVDKTPVEALISAHIAAGLVPAALAEFTRYVELDPPGLDRFSVALNLASELARDPRTRPQSLELARFAASSWAARMMEIGATFEIRTGHFAQAKEWLDQCGKRYGVDRDAMLFGAVLKVVASKGKDGWSDLEKNFSHGSRADFVAAVTLEQSGTVLPATTIGKALSFLAIEQELINAVTYGSLREEDVVRLIKSHEAMGPTSPWYQAQVRWALSALAGQEIEKQRSFTEPLGFSGLLKVNSAAYQLGTVKGVTGILSKVAAAGWDESLITRVIQGLDPLITPEDRSLWQTLAAHPKIARTWVELANDRMETVRIIKDVLDYLWMSGRDEDLRTFLHGLTRPYGGQPPRPRPIGDELVRITGSLPAAQRFLVWKGVAWADLGKWEVQFTRYPSAAVRDRERRFRPDKSDKDPLGTPAAVQAQPPAPSRVQTQSTSGGPEAPR